MKQEAVAKKLEAEIEKDTKDFSTLSLEKRWRLINQFFNELTFADDIFASTIKTLHKIVDQVFRTYEGEKNLTK